MEGGDKAAALADALERGELNLSSPAGALQNYLNVSGGRLHPYQDALLSTSDVQQLIVALRTSWQTAARIVAAQPVVQVAWTYPGYSRPGLRTTGGVAREIIESSRSTLLIVGYTISVDAALSGLASQTVDSIARAAERGVLVTAVLHRDANRQALLQSWRASVPLPSIFTWPVAEDDKAAMHAKVLISDRRDGLITSANLTYHGFERNIEMGLRVTGAAVSEISDRIHELIAAGDLVPWPRDGLARSPKRP